MAREASSARHPDTCEELQLLLERVKSETDPYRAFVSYYGRSWEETLQSVDARDQSVCDFWAVEGGAQGQLGNWQDCSLADWGIGWLEEQFQHFQHFAMPEDRRKWDAVLMFDGGARPNLGTAGSGFVLREAHGEVLKRKAIAIFSDERLRWFTKWQVHIK